ncbi:hypothetical protein KUF71_011444 [Frankliniella fusca]|uniref:Uncharacterized protein n=1 Tax=Frankliniella fusca TaxID=407009 RepID=A0AAE1I4R0_9NEOP|nr:hypothetical protein KUF71_011444 [Frankliniella fusca]
MHQELKHLGVAADEIWKATVSREKSISSNWSSKWNWMLNEYNAMSVQLEELKKLRPAAGRPKAVETRSCLPMPDTASRVVSGDHNFCIKEKRPNLKV